MENIDVFDEHEEVRPLVTVVGIGEVGSLAINYLTEESAKNIDYIVIDSDVQALDKSKLTPKFIETFAVIVVLDIQDLNSILCAEFIANAVQEEEVFISSILFNSSPSSVVPNNKLNKSFHTILTTSNAQLPIGLLSNKATGTYSPDQLKLFYCLDSLLAIMQYDFFANWQHGIDKWDVLSALSGSSEEHNFCGGNIASRIPEFEKSATVTISNGCASKNEESLIAIRKAVSACQFISSRKHNALVFVTINRNDFDRFQAHKIVAYSDSRLEYVIVAPTSDPLINSFAKRGFSSTFTTRSIDSFEGSSA